MDEVYDDFVSIVARGRGRTKDEVERLARGRIYAATDALAVGLVDELGNLALAIQRAAERAGIDPSLEPVRVHPHGRRPMPPMSPMQQTPPEPSPTRAIAETLLGRHAWWMTLARICERERVLLLDERLAGAWT
jgi:protease-4